MKFLLYAYVTAVMLTIFSVTGIAQEQQTQETSTTNQNQNTTTTETQTQQEPAKTQPVYRPKPFADTLDIEGQFSYAIDKSSNFQDYKVIKQNWILKLKQNTLDTMDFFKSNLNSAIRSVQVKNSTIDSLGRENLALKTQLNEKNSFSFFGIMVSKSGYDSIMWAIISGLIVALALLFLAFKRSFAVTVQTKKDLIDVKEEFESFRKKALKSKEEAVRQLYDELNKYKNR